MISVAKNLYIFDVCKYYTERNVYTFDLFLIKKRCIEWKQEN